VRWHGHWTELPAIEAPGFETGPALATGAVPA
jgi:hypothetical protein